MMMQTTMMMQTAPQVSLRPKFAMGAKARAPLRAARRSHVVLAADTVVIGLAADSGCGKSYVSGGSTVCASRHMSIRASAPLFSLLSPPSPSFPSPSLPNWRIRVRNRLISRRFSDGGIDRFDGRLEARWNPSSFLTHARTHALTTHRSTILSFISTFMRRVTGIFGGDPKPPAGGNPDSNTLISEMTTVICLDDYHSLDREGRKVAKVCLV